MDTVDYNLRLGMLAVQMGFLAQDEFVSTVQEWNLKKERSLVDILLSRELVDESTCRVLTEMLQQQSMYGKTVSVAQSLATLPGGEEIQQALRGLDDDGLLSREKTVPEPSSLCLVSQIMLASYLLASGFETNPVQENWK